MFSNPECTEGAWMTSLQWHYFQASQAVHGADGVTTLNAMIVCGPKLILIFPTAGWSAPPNCTNFDPI